MTEKDPVGSRFGMWLFLYSELMLFAGLFILFAVYFNWYKDDFVASGRELSLAFGTVNTVILLVSSFMVAAAVTAIRRGSQRAAAGFLLCAILLGGVFLSDKYVEWSHKISHGLYPNSPHLISGPHGRTMFYSLYYVITGLHGIHIIIGMTVLAFCAGGVLRGSVTAEDDGLLVNGGLYWHLVDLIWIFIFPSIHKCNWCWFCTNP